MRTRVNRQVLEAVQAKNCQKYWLWRACNLTAFIPCHSGPVDYPFASRHERPGFNPQGGTYPSLGRHANNLIIPLDLTQPFCPGFTLAPGPPSGFTTDIVGCWGGALWRACNLTAFIACLTSPVDYPFASRHEGPGFNPQGGTYVNRDSPVSFV